jgi:carboxyl-terminal processing protease
LQVENTLELKTVEIYKTRFLENCVFYRTNDSSYRFTGDDKEDRVAVGNPLAMPYDWAYIRLTQFNKNASDEFDGAMELFKAEGKKHLVLDLRGNGGGYMGVLESIAKYFCKDASTRQPVVAVADYGEDKETFKADANLYYEYFSANSRVCLLADVETASASEGLIGCMLDYATISYGDICLSSHFGATKTFGKGIMQTTYPIRLLKGGAVRLTTATVYWPMSNRCIHGRGVLPEDGTKTASGNYTDDELKNAFLALGIN